MTAIPSLVDGRVTRCTGLALALTLANLLVVEPKTTALMFQRYAPLLQHYRTSFLAILSLWPQIFSCAGRPQTVCTHIIWDGVTTPLLQHRFFDPHVPGTCSQRLHGLQGRSSRLLTRLSGLSLAVSPSLRRKCPLDGFNALAKGF